MNNKELFLNFLNSEEEEENPNITLVNGITLVNDKKDKCLICDEQLQNNYITLDCNHKFNFVELYNEVVEQKTKKILDNSRLKINELKCPYCRTITPELLPYLKYYNSKLIRGVNHPADLTMKLFECEYVKNSKICGKNACTTKYGIFCNNHLKYNLNEETILDTINPTIFKTYKNMSVKNLKDELRKNKLKLSGKKDDLINRLLINII